MLHRMRQGGRPLVLFGLVLLLAGLAGCGTGGELWGGEATTTFAGQSSTITGGAGAPADSTFTTSPVEAVECTRFVAPGGSDANPGSEDAPWASFDQAGLAAGPGDVVCFRAGTYTSEDVHLEVSGEAAAPITFTAYPGEAVTLDGVEAGGVVVLSPGVSYVRLSGFEMVNYRIWGLSLYGENHYVQLDHLTITGGEAGVRLTSGNSGEDSEFGPISHVTLADSRITGVLYTAVDCTPGPCDDMLFARLEISGAGLTQEESYGADGLGLERGQRVTVEDCAIHDNGGDGIDLNSRDYEGYAEGIVVRRNRVYRNHLQGIKLWAGGTMVYNQVWGQGVDPVMLAVHPGVFVVDHNTIAYNMWDPAYSGRDYSFVAGWPQDDGAAQLDLTLTNNIFAFNGSDATDGPTGIYLGPGVRLVSSGGNLFFSRDDVEIEAQFVTARSVEFSQADISSGGWAAAAGVIGDFVGDPLFAAEWPDVDLALSPGSPARGTALDGSDVGAGG